MLRPCFIPTSAAAYPFTSSINRRQHHAVLYAIPPHQPHEAASSLSSVMLTLPTILTSVKVFDGSEITNAVVVSNSYWSELSSKLPYLLLAQLLAAIIFVVIASLVTTQGKFILDQVASNNVNDDNDTQTKTKGKKNQFRRLDDPPPRTIDVAKLFLCIFIDILGSANEAIPLVGELVDVIYAPIAALVLRQLFAGSNIVFLLEFTEEILPFTDVLPLATICWVVEAFFGDGALARALRIGEFAPNRGDFIDVDTTRAKEKSMDNSDDEEKSKFLLQSDKRNNAKR